MRKHRTVWGLVAAVAGIALLVGGVATASNMGFKFVPQIPGTAGANVFNLSLPWNNNYTNADSLFTDIAGCERVARVTSSGGFSSWLGFGVGGDNFTVVKGEAYVVGGGPSGNTPVIVGSHDPNFTFSFNPGVFNASAPYHQTYTNADGVFVAIQGTCPGLSRVARITPSGGFSSWLGFGVGGDNFALQLGTGVVVDVSAACSGFVWAHY